MPNDYSFLLGTSKPEAGFSKMKDIYGILRNMVPETPKFGKTFEDQDNPLIGRRLVMKNQNLKSAFHTIKKFWR